MNVRLGYACISETVNITTSSSYTYTNYCKEKDEKKLDRIIRSNFLSLYELLKYNEKNNIHFYRMSSNLVPLATKKEVILDYITPYQEEYQKIKEQIIKTKIRIDFHPNEYCVLNSIKKEVVNQSIEILKYHYRILEALGIKEKILVLHIGSLSGGKKAAITRFCNSFHQLEKKIQKAIAIENDDKVFTIDDCIEISNRLNIPIVLDYHHHLCNKGTLTEEEFLPQVIATWKGKIPKMHFSSPKNRKPSEIRSHHDYIDPDAFIHFLETIKSYTKKVDIMIEAKKKDEAMFRLIRQLKYKTNYVFADETTFFIE